MDERSIKRLAVILLTAVILILVFRSVGLRMATKAGEEHQKALAARQANTAPEPAPAPPPPAPDYTAAPVPEATPAPAPDATPAQPSYASAPAITPEPAPAASPGQPAGMQDAPAAQAPNTPPAPAGY